MIFFYQGKCMTTVVPMKSFQYHLIYTNTYTRLIIVLKQKNGI